MILEILKTQWRQPMVRILCILACFTLFPSFALGGEGEVKSKEIKIYLNKSKTLFLQPEIKVQLQDYGSRKVVPVRVTDITDNMILLSIKFEF